MKTGPPLCLAVTLFWIKAIAMAKTRATTRISDDPDGVGGGPGNKRAKTTLHEKVMHGKGVVIEEEDFDRRGGAYIAPVEIKRLREVRRGVQKATDIDGRAREGGSRAPRTATPTALDLSLDLSLPAHTR